MIELNLIKTRLEKFKRQRVVLNLFIIYFAGLVFIFMIMGMHFIGNRVEIRQLHRNIKEISAKIAAEEEKVNYIQKKDIETRKLLKNLGMYSSEYKKRVLWSPILSFVGERVPSKICLESFSLTKSSSEEKGSKKKRIILITGYVLPETTNERETIDRFIRNMSSARFFEKVCLKEVRKEMKDTQKIMSFNIECELKTTEVN